jgi:hypothetical protein
LKSEEDELRKVKVSIPLEVLLVLVSSDKSIYSASVNGTLTTDGYSL